MDEIIAGLWIGNLSSALDVENLKAHNIYSVLSAMRGRITIHETFIRHQILLDDTEGADILIHLLPSIHFIQAELDKGRGVLVHCQAGVSRSATVVAAYLMYSRNIDTTTALKMIESKRPGVEPNQGFLLQLELFHKVHYKISRRDKAIRMFYLGRTVEEVMNGDGSPLDTEMFAKYPRTPADSVPPTPGGPRRRIRCKMCRRELASREHMLDHGQLGPATPAAITPIISRRPSESLPLSRRPSLHRSREPSVHRPSTEVILENGVASPTTDATIQSLGDLRSLSRSMEASGSMSALQDDDENDEKLAQSQSSSALTPIVGGSQSAEDSLQAARMLGRRMSDAVTMTITEKQPTANSDEQHMPTTTISPWGEQPETQKGEKPNDVASQLDITAKLAELRSMQTSYDVKSVAAATRPPILANAKCSGYFVEPMTWMEPFIGGGQLAGKIVCPNEKCSAKLGHFDWAGMCCGCKEWVTPGFCISRSKVDEIG